jgi:DNA primase
MNKTSKKIDLGELIEKVDIVSLVEEYNIPLEESGDNFVALCPFHPDNKTKSFFVFPLTNTWYCFGCKKGSSVFDFVMEIEHKSFQEAVHFLAEKVGYENNFSLDTLKKKLENLESKNDNVTIMKFREVRESVENQIFNKVKEKYYILENVLLYKLSSKEYEECYKRLKDLWRWYDESQYWFDLYFCYYKAEKNVDLEFLIKKLHSFYLKFLEKFDNLFSV